MADPRFYFVSGSKTLAEVIDGLDVQAIEPPYLDAIIDAPQALDASRPGGLSFLTSKKYKDDLSTAKATACFVAESAASLVGEAHIIPIVSKHPRAHFARSVAHFVTPKSLSDDGEPATIAPSADVHPTAIIGAGAKIDEKVQIAPYAVIGPGVHIGQSSKIESHVLIECADIGQNCLIKSGAKIGTEGFGMDGDEKGVVALPHIGRVLLGDRVRIGCQTTIDRGFLGDTVIEDDVKIDNLVHIAHNVRIGAGSMLAGRVGISGSCHIGRNVLMGGAVGLADHITIGDNVQIAAAAGVMHDIPDGEVWSGVPAMPIREFMRMTAATRKLGKKPKG